MLLRLFMFWLTDIMKYNNADEAGNNESRDRDEMIPMPVSRQ